MTAPNGADAAGARNRAAVDALEEQAQQSVRAALYVVLADLLDELDTTGAVPTVDALASVARSAWRRAVDTIRAWVRDTFRTLLTRAVDNVPDDLAPDVPAATVEDRVGDLLDDVIARLDSVPDTVTSRIATVLRDGYDAGDSPAELRQAVAGVLGRDEWDDEVVRIARTTTTTVYNAAHTAAANELERTLDEPLRRMWIATQDDRTRPTHREAHAQVINSGQRFRVGDALLRFPGDPLGPANEVILCRCVATVVVNGPAGDLVIDLAHRVAGREANALDNLTDDAATTAAARTTADDLADAIVRGILAERAATLVSQTRMPPQFVTYWTVGEGAARIRWGSDGDFRRCQRALRRYLKPGQVDGACANLHRLATGKWPGQDRGDVAAEGTDDMPCPCEDMTPAEITAALADLPDTPGPEAVAAVSLEDARSGGMVALIPSAADAARLAVDGDGAIPAAELHATLLFLGEGSDWAGTEQGAALTALVERVAADVGPITGFLWQTGATGDEAGATAMYLVGDDTGRLAELQAGLLMAGGEMVPPQHSPFVAHISTRYGSGSLDGMGQVGTEVVFDRLRVSFGDQDQDFELTGDHTLDLDDDPVSDETEDAMPDDGDTITAANPSADPAPEGDREYPAPVVSLRAAAAAGTILAQAAANAPEKPPGEWFRPVAVEGPTPPTVTAEGRVWGHIGQADVCHVGIKDECVTIPPTRTGYGAFHRGEIETAEGDMVAVGYLYTGCDHSDLGMDLDTARDYLDSSCTRTAAGRVHDTEWGPLFVGTVVPGVTADAISKLWKLSGEWFMAPLELHAAVGVEDAGFPVDGTGDEVRVADAAPPLAASADAGAGCKCPAGDACPCAAVVADTMPDNDPDEPDNDRDSEGDCVCPDDDPDCVCPDDDGPDDDPPAAAAAAAEPDVLAAVAAIDSYRTRAALRTAGPAVAAAEARRAHRTVAAYQRRG